MKVSDEFMAEEAKAMVAPNEIATRNFEGWVMGQSWFVATIGIGRCSNGREYNDPLINSRWQGWKAAIEHESRGGSHE